MGQITGNVSYIYKEGELEHIQALGLIGLLNLVVYYRTLFFGYVGDDVERAEREQIFRHIYHRWWMQFIGMKHRNSMVSHMITLLTHTLCAMTIYIALGKFFGLWNVAFLTALLFSINPINMQGSIWISGRNYVVSTILALSMFLIPSLSWISYMATSHFAVNAWFAPLAFLGTPYWYMVAIIPLIWVLTKNNREVLNRKLWETGGLKTTNTEMRAIKFIKIIPFLKTYYYYFVLTIFPYRLGVEHSFIRGFGTNKTDNRIGYKIDQYFLGGLILFVTSCVLSLQGIVWGWTPLRWGVFWFMINISMWCNFVTYQQQIAERYCYIASVGLMFALAGILINHPMLFVALFVAYLIRLLYAMPMYLNDYWAVEYTLMEQKNMHYMWLMRGVKKFMNRDHMGALYDFNEAYIHKPYDLKILYNLATTTFLLGDVVKAREFLEKARVNVYDELQDSVKPAFDNLEAMIKTVEEAKAKGQTQVQVDMSRILVVKALTFFFLYGIYNLCLT